MNNRVIELDNRGLQPPEPMMRTLQALKEMDRGGQVIIHNDRVPMFLIEELRSLKYDYTVDSREDGSAIITITKR
ncbi:DUF2249 domain-containing protein [Paenibacillus sp. GD4]|uniref:DUF2249 domain-containing protein n=1 Tax=Paenibacillus sp. GD4 TaxID=3068890 RepID=UPI00279691C6|nr:DUF2249 domain-containing protein [Paenibacillus sp. GD4]MDQ1913867.1 DUF2249 domain-containing protein [Paenibacillus sp. GD4]